MPNSFQTYPTIGDSRLSDRRRGVAGVEQPAVEATEPAPFDSTTATIPEVKQYVTDHPDERAAVLEAEQARGDKARTSLIEWLDTDDGE